MGLFNKRKEEGSKGINDIPMPVEDTSESIANLRMPMANNVNLSAPPIPGGTLSDIKNQVSQPESSMPISSMPAVQDLPDVPNMQMPQEPFDGMMKSSNSNMEGFGDDSDSLFDFSELDTELAKDKSLPVKEDSQVTNVISPISKINFIEDDKQKAKDDTFFVTTTQFKALLEIVDAVKTKVKDATQTHLKLMDIKSEEDIEYENLRKDFQFIEEKLYEVDSLIFDNK